MQGLMIDTLQDHIPSKKLTMDPTKNSGRRSSSTQFDANPDRLSLHRFPLPPSPRTPLSPPATSVSITSSSLSSGHSSGLITPTSDSYSRLLPRSLRIDLPTSPTTFHSSIFISPSFDPSKPPQLPLPPLPTHASPSHASPSIIASSSDSFDFPSQDEYLLSTPRVGKDDHFNGLAIEPSSTLSSWSNLVQNVPTPERVSDCNWTTTRLFEDDDQSHFNLDSPTLPDASWHRYKVDRGACIDEELQLDAETLGSRLYLSSSEEELKFDEEMTGVKKDLSSTPECTAPQTPMTLAIEASSNETSIESESFEGLEYFTKSTAKRASNAAAEKDLVNAHEHATHKPAWRSVINSQQWTLQEPREQVTGLSQGHSDDDGSEIDLEESLDRLAKRLGYQAEDSEDQPSDRPLLDSSFRDLEKDDDHDDHDSLVGFDIDHPLLTSMPSDESTLVPSDFCPSLTSETSSRSHSDGRPNSLSSGSSFTNSPRSSFFTSTPATTLAAELKRKSLTNSSGRFSLTKLDFDKLREPVPVLKTSSSASVIQYGALRRPTQFNDRRPMKIIEEPSSSDEEEFDLSLDHRNRNVPTLNRSVVASHLLARSTPAIQRSGLRMLPVSLTRSSTDPQVSASVVERVQERVKPSLISRQLSSASLVGLKKTGIPPPSSAHTLMKRPMAKSLTPIIPPALPPTNTLKSKLSMQIIPPSDPQAKTMKVKSSMQDVRSPFSQQALSVSALSKSTSHGSPKLSSNFSRPVAHPQILQDRTALSMSERRLKKIPKPITSSPLRIKVNSEKRESTQTVLGFSPSQPSSSSAQASQPILIQSSTLGSSHPDSLVPPTPKLGFVPPPGKPGSMERREWLRASLTPSSIPFDTSLTCEPQHSGSKRPVSASVVQSVQSVTEFRRASAGQLERTAVEIGQEMPNSTKMPNEERDGGVEEEQNSTPVHAVPTTPKCEEQPDSRSPEFDAELPEKQSEKVDEPISPTTGRKLRLKPLWLHSLPPLAEDHPTRDSAWYQAHPRASLPVPRSIGTRRNSAAPYQSFSPLSPSFSRSVSASTPLEPSHPTSDPPASISRTSHRRSPSSLNRVRSSAPISIRQLAYC